MPGSFRWRRRLVDQPDTTTLYNDFADYATRCAISDRVVRYVLVYYRISTHKAVRAYTDTFPDDCHRANVGITTDAYGSALVLGDSAREGPAHGIVRIDLNSGRNRAVAPDSKTAGTIEDCEWPDPRLLPDAHVTDDYGAIVNARTFPKPKETGALPSVDNSVTEGERAVPLVAKLALTFPMKTLKVGADIGEVLLAHGATAEVTVGDGRLYRLANSPVRASATCSDSSDVIPAKSGSVRERRSAM